jgi:hypothetical protein
VQIPEARAAQVGTGAVQAGAENASDVSTKPSEVGPAAPLSGPSRR